MRDSERRSRVHTESYFQWARTNPCLFEAELGHGGFQGLTEEEQRRRFFATEGSRPEA